MRWIYISPHLDDAIFSVGGVVYEQVFKGTPVEIWTVMCGFPEISVLSSFANRLHARWGVDSPEEAIRIRLMENEKAAEIVGAKTFYLNFVDGMYRLGVDGAFLYERSFGKLHREDKDMPRQIASAIAQNLRSGDELVFPLALGGHVDHVVVHMASKFLDQSLFYYADIPYLFDAPWIVRWKTMGMTKVFQPISEDGLSYWLKSMQAYESQIKSEFMTLEAMQRTITTYWIKNRGLHFWKRHRRR
jgi:LmbE family N-acetylglucosaminyl deacetylase